MLAIIVEQVIFVVFLNLTVSKITTNTVQKKKKKL